MSGVTAPNVGAVLAGRYRLDSPLGSGGFATVFRGFDLEAGHAVAVKLLHPDQPDGYSAYRTARFEREVEAIRGLRSPHTVRFVDAGAGANGALFIVFELLAGRDLGALIADGAQPPALVRHIVLQLLDSLAEAHASGLLHRDIKPANIRVFEADGDPYRVKLLDFGIAKPTAADAPALTATGDVVGTLRYCAPEQAFGGALTASSDLYAVGLLAIELLTGRPSEHLRLIGEGRTVALEPAECPDDQLRPVVNRLVALAPEHRWRTAGDVRRALAARADLPSTLDPGRASAGWAPGRMTAVIVSVLSVPAAAFLATRGVSSPSHHDSAPRSPALRRVAPEIVRSATTSAAAPVDDIRDSGGAAAMDAGSTVGRCGAAPPFTGLGRLTAYDEFAAYSWTTYIPRNYDPHREHPMIVMLHESAKSGREFIEYSRVKELADRVGLVVIAPDGDVVEPWNDTVDGIVRAAEQTIAQLCVDRSRVYAIGHSSGGTAAEELPCEFPLAAIASSAARNVAPRACVTQATPTMHIAGLDDGYNPVDGGVSCSGSVKISLAQKEARWREVNGCGSARRTYYEHGTSICYTWPCEVAPLVSCHLDGGRNWPGVSGRLWDVKGCDGVPAEFPYLDVIWAFFARHRRAD